MAENNISVCMIAKDEESNIGKCLDAITPYGFDIVVVDTGSADNTVAEAKKRGARVFSFPWKKDFSAARNFSIMQARCDRILVLDCDEVVTDIDVEQLFALAKENPEAAGCMTRQNHQIANGTKTIYTDSPERFFDRRYFSYTEPIHEQLTHRTLGQAYKRYPIPLTADHTGYVGDAEALQKKAERNNEILFAELAKDPDNPYLLFQIGQSYNMIYDSENALIYYGKALEKDVDPAAEWVQMLVIAYANCLLRTGREKDALGLAGVYDAFSGTADFLCAMGRVYMANGKYMEAMMEFVKALHCPVAREEGTNSFIPAYNMGLINEMMGDAEAALAHYRNCGDFPMAKERIRELTKLPH